MFDINNEFSADAKLLLGKRIPRNTNKASQTPINKLAIYLAEKSNKYSKKDLDILNNPYDRTGDRDKLLDKSIFVMRVEMFPEDTSGHIPNSVNDWKEDQLKNINNLLIEFFVSLRNSGELKSAKTYDNYLRRLQRAFRIFYKYEKNLTTGPVFTTLILTCILYWIIFARTFKQMVNQVNLTIFSQRKTYMLPIHHMDCLRNIRWDF